MKKLLGCLVVLSLSACTHNDMPQNPQPPMPDKMEMVQHCISHSGVRMPRPSQPGQPPHKLTHKQKRVVDMCMKENGVEPGSEMAPMAPPAAPMQ